MSDYTSKYKDWLDSSVVNQDTKDELIAIKDNQKEIEDRFYKDLDFGTGGLRGVIAAGTNRMNIYTVRLVTQGLCNHIIAIGEQARGVVISFDSRHNSTLFATECAKVLAANGIKAYLFYELSPTPELSFAVRELGCVMGIMITASHNPAIYNGYKVYGADGGQLAPDASDSILAIIESLDIFADIKVIDLDAAKQQGLFEMIGDEMHNAFLDQVQKQCINPEIIKSTDLKLVYTPFHGAGNKPVRAILSRVGFRNVLIVKEQELPDPNFSTVVSPNPENAEGFALAILLAKENDVDLIIGTDPDCDRVGVVVRNSTGEYIPLTGNQTGILLAEYILSQKSARGVLPKDGYIVKTIVTTELIAPICKKYGIELKNVLTGFKFIGDKIKESEQSGIGTYLFGFEESYGYLSGTHARDKDAVVASMLIAEMAAYYKTKNKSLYEALIAIYAEYGFCVEGNLSVQMTGKDGMEKMTKLMDDIRGSVPKTFGDFTVTAFRDYKTSVRHDFLANTQAPIDIPKSNVLYFELADDAYFVIRPSGTEPKIKLYFGVCGTSLDAAQTKLDELMRTVHSALF